MTSLAPSGELGRACRFVAAGGLNTAVCYSLFATLVRVAGWRYEAALVADYSLGIALGYTLQRFSTFADRRHVTRSLAKYVAAYGAAFVVNLAMLEVLIRLARIEPLAAQASSLLLVAVASYALQHQWVFRARTADRSAARAPTLAD